MLKKIVKCIIFRVIYPLIYNISKIKKVKKNKVIIIENHEKKLTENYYVLVNELKKRDYLVKIFFLQVYTSSWTAIIKRSIRVLYELADAGFIFLDESNSLFGSFKLRKDTQMIQVWHACGAFKKWGYSVADKAFGDDLNALRRYSGHKNYTLVPISGDEICWAYEEAFGIEAGSGIVKPIGVSRTDIFFDEAAKENAYIHLAQLGIDNHGKKIIAYMPTFRGSIANAKGPDQFKIEYFDKISDEYILLIKNHPFVKQPVVIPDSCKKFCYEIRDELTVNEMLFIADICITDYSSVVFEYSLLNKPIFFYAYDRDAYDLERGFYYSYEEFVPGPIIYNMDELIDKIAGVNNYDYSKLDIFRKRFMNGCDGHATERLLEEIGIKY